MYKRIETTKSIEIVTELDEGMEPDRYMDYPIATYIDEEGNVLEVTYWHPHFSIYENDKPIEVTDEILKVLQSLLAEVKEEDKKDNRSIQGTYWIEHYKHDEDIIKLKWATYLLPATPI